jgi:uncharacterized protein (DUF433 family)
MDWIQYQSTIGERIQSRMTEILHQQGKQYPQCTLEDIQQAANQAEQEMGIA